MQDEYTISVDGWFRSGWHTFKKRSSLLVRGVAVIIAYSLILLLMGYFPGGEAISIVIQLTAGLVLTAGWLNFCLRLVRDEDVKVTDIFLPFYDFMTVWLVSITISLIVAAGTMLFIIPGIYAMVRIGMGMFAVVERKTGVTDTLKFSARLTSGHEGKLFVYYGILIGLYGLAVFPYLAGRSMLGAVTTSVFNFVLTPLLGVTYASAYDSLLYALEGPELEGEKDSGSGG